jgi:hypothetical protein
MQIHHFRDGDTVGPAHTVRHGHRPVAGSSSLAGDRENR